MTAPSEQPPRPLPNTYWVRPARFLAGEYPGDWDSQLARERLRRFLESGVTAFLDLTRPGELEPYAPLLEAEAETAGRLVSYRRQSIPDLDVPTREHMVAILDEIDSLLAGGQNLYLHCWGGVGRTGTVVGCYLVRHGLTGEAALVRLADWWSRVEKRNRHPRSPETAAQMDMIRSWEG
jgi:hypothetical protein